MKVRYTILFLLLCSFLATSQAVLPVISDPVSVTAGITTFGKHLPRVFTLADGTVAVFWSKAGANSGIYMAKMENSAFGEVIEVPTGDLDPDIWSGGLGPGYAVFENSIYITFEIWGEAIYMVKSDDGGLSFDPPVTVLVPPPGRVATLPAITTDHDGNPIIGCITTNNSEQEARYEVVISTDGGLTFGDPIDASFAADGEEVCECCPSSLLVSDQGDIFVSFRNNNSNVRDIWISRSNEEGTAFDDAVDVDETNWVIAGCPSTGPHSILAGSSIINVFYSAAQDWDVGVYLSTLDPVSLDVGQTLKLPYGGSGPATQNFPRIAGNSDTIGVVFQEHTGTFYNIAFSWSLEGVDGLLDEAMILSDGSTPQNYADIHFSDTKFHIVYEDQASATPLYHSIHFENATATVESSLKEEGFRIVPNPARDYFTIESLNHKAESTLLEIISINGTIVQHKNFTGSSEVIDISDLESGLYLVKLSSKNKYWVERLLVQ